MEKIITLLQIALLIILAQPNKTIATTFSSQSYTNSSVNIDHNFSLKPSNTTSNTTSTELHGASYDTYIADFQEPPVEEQETSATSSTNVEEEPLIVAVLDLSEKFSNDDQLKLILQIDEYRHSPQIHAILVKLENMHISLGFASALFLELKETARYKPVVGLILDHCTGSCFYTAVGTNPIIASPLASVGGIGAEFTSAKYRNTQLRGQDLHADVEYHIFSAGEYKTVFHPYTPEPTAEHKRYMQERVNDQYEQFCKDVIATRGVNEVYRDSWANGHTHIAGKAQKMGLIDEVGTYSAALNAITKSLEKVGYDTERRPLLVVHPTTEDKKQENNKSAHENREN